LHERLRSLKEDGIDINFESADIDPWTGKIEVQQLKVKLGHDTLHRPLQAVIPYVLVKGIAIIPFLTDRSLVIGSISLAQPTISLTLNAELYKASGKKNILENINIDRVSITEALLFVKDSLARDTIIHIATDMHMKALGLEKENDSLTWKDADVEFTNLLLNFPRDLYRCTIKHMRLGLTDRVFELDSMRISPTVGRRAFMKKFGKEIDYIRGHVPSIRATGVNLYSYPRQSLEADKIEFNFRLHVFRDKRYPFRKAYHTTLPVHYLQRMPLSLSIDTAKVIDSYVSYEEYPEEGDSTGMVFFDNLQATITSIHNDASLGWDIAMRARAKFMGSGDLDVHFLFPADTNKPYKLNGSLRNFQLTKLNSMLGPAIQARVESGVMTGMEFQFLYNKYRADGSLELNYKDLKITSLRENKRNKAAVSLIKTLLLNTFIIKKNMDEDVREDKRTGTILFHRNTRRSIFNYWWKSVLSGVKSAYKLDKLPPVAKGDRKNHDRKKKDAAERKL
jgi:hypothetical protein